MRRDVCYFFPASVDAVYNAYYGAATNSRFRREPNQEPYHTMSFGLNFSMMYNFNGGACTLRFMPYQNGTAVNLRFSIAQLVGARYEKYAEDLTEDAVKLLGVAGQTLNLDVELFTAPGNQITPAMMQQPVYAPVPMQAPPHVPAQPQGLFCMYCGAALQTGDRFCSACGKPVGENKVFCRNCGKEAAPGAAYCSGCGNKL